jgi:hydroxyacylglutathione hydrolase
VEADRPVVLVVERVEDLDDLARQAIRIGCETIAGYLQGGLGHWADAGRPLETGGALSIDGLAAALADESEGSPAPLLIDVRQASEFDEGHVPGAVHIGTGSLGERLEDLPRDRPLATMCASGYRSAVAASLLRAAGFEDVRWVPDGIDAWRAAGYPVVLGES